MKTKSCEFCEVQELWLLHKTRFRFETRLISSSSMIVSKEMCSQSLHEIKLSKQAKQFGIKKVQKQWETN